VKVLRAEERPLAAVTIIVELREAVFLLREPKRICIGASTWKRGRVWIVGLGRIRELRESVKDLVDEFINDYLAANPKESEAKSKNNK